MTLVIPNPLVQEIREHGRRAYPRECCGLLIGDLEHGRKSVSALRPAPNVREDSPENRYLVDPKVQLDAEKAAHREGRSVVGVYHSHPDHPARPSEFDRQHAWPVYSYIIVAVERGEPRELQCWTLRADGALFEAEQLLVS